MLTAFKACPPVQYRVAVARFEALRPAESEEGEYNEGAALDGLKRMTT